MTVVESASPPDIREYNKTRQNVTKSKAEIDHKLSSLEEAIASKTSLRETYRQMKVELSLELKEVRSSKMIVLDQLEHLQTFIDQNDNAQLQEEREALASKYTSRIEAEDLLEDKIREVQNMNNQALQEINNLKKTCKTYRTKHRELAEKLSVLKHEFDVQTRAYEIHKGADAAKRLQSREKRIHSGENCRNSPLKSQKHDNWAVEESICDMLISHLNRITQSPDGHDVSVISNNAVACSSPKEERGANDECLHVFRRKEESGLDLFNVVAGNDSKKRRRCRRSNQNSGRKKDNKIHLEPVLFAKFDTVGIPAPLHLSDIPHTIAELQTKKQFYTEYPSKLQSQSHIVSALEEENKERSSMRRMSLTLMEEEQSRRVQEWEAAKLEAELSSLQLRRENVQIARVASEQERQRRLNDIAMIDAMNHEQRQTHRRNSLFELDREQERRIKCVEHEVQICRQLEKEARDKARSEAIQAEQTARDEYTSQIEQAAIETQVIRDVSVLKAIQLAEEERCRRLEEDSSADAASNELRERNRCLAAQLMNQEQSARVSEILAAQEQDALVRQQNIKFAKVQVKQEQNRLLTLEQNAKLFEAIQRANSKRQSVCMEEAERQSRIAQNQKLATQEQYFDGEGVTSSTLESIVDLTEEERIRRMAEHNATFKENVRHKSQILLEEIVKA